MIDFEKERESFEAWQDSIGSNIAKRGLEYVNDRTASEWFSWRNRAALAQTEINELKQKLARYENPDYVLVPRAPNKKMLKEMESSYYFEQGWSHYFGEEAHERMLKAVEKENAQQDS